MTVLGQNTARHEMVIPDAPPGSLVLAWGVATDVGHKRSHNEDSLVAIAPILTGDVSALDAPAAGVRLSSSPDR